VDELWLDASLIAVPYKEVRGRMADQLPDSIQSIPELKTNYWTFLSDDFGGKNNVYHHLLITIGNQFLLSH
jgi:hypothetical protein